MPIIGQQGNTNYDLDNFLETAGKLYRDKYEASQPKPFDPMTAPLPGAYVQQSEPSGMDLSKYPFEIPGSVTAENLPEFLAAQQTTMERLGLTAANLIPNIAVGIMENFGYLPEMGDMYYGGDFTNDFVKAMQGSRNYFGDIYEPLYAPGVTGKITDPDWWVVNGGGLVESLGEFAGSAYIVGGALGGISKGFSAAVNASARAARAAEGIAKGLTAYTSGYMEGAISAGQIYKDVYDEKLARGLGYTEATESAAKAAATTAILNTAIIGTLNLTTVAPLFKSADDIAKQRRYAEEMGLSKMVGESVDDQMARLSSQTYKNPDLFTIFGRQAPISKSALRESGQESLEEILNVFAEKEGRQAGGVDKDTDFLTTFLDAAKSEEGILSGLLGALGGIGESQILRRLPIHKVTTPEETITDATGKPVTKPGETKWMSSKALEDKENEEKFELFKNSVIDDWNTIKQGQKELGGLVASLANATDSEAVAIKAAIEMKKNQLFNLRSYGSLQNGNTQALVDMFEEIGQLDNTKVLSDEIDTKITELRTQQSAAADQDTKNALETQINTLESERNSVLGMTAAMKAGVATAVGDDSYKDIAKKKIQRVRELEKVYDNVMARYNYGDAIDYGFAKYTFLTKAEALDYDDEIVRLNDVIKSLETELDANPDYNKDMNVLTFMKKFSLIENLKRDRKKLLEEANSLRASKEDLNPNEIRTKMAALGVPLPDLPVETTTEKLLEKLDSYVDERSRQINKELNNAQKDFDEVIDNYHEAKKAMLPADAVYDYKKENEELVKIYRAEKLNFDALANAQVRKATAVSKVVSLNNDFIKLTSAKGRQQFIDYAKELFKNRMNQRQNQGDEVDKKLTEFRFINELQMKGYPADVAKEIVKAMINGTAVPPAYRNVKIFLKPFRLPSDGKHMENKIFILRINPKGFVNLVEAGKDDRKKKKAIVNIKTSGDNQFIDPKSSEAKIMVPDKKSKKKGGKKAHSGVYLAGNLNVYSIMRSFRVMNQVDMDNQNTLSNIKAKRATAMNVVFEHKAILTNRLGLLKSQIDSLEQDAAVAATFVDQFESEINTFLAVYTDDGTGAANVGKTAAKGIATRRDAIANKIRKAQLDIERVNSNGRYNSTTKQKKVKEIQDKLAVALTEDMTVLTNYMRKLVQNQIASQSRRKVGKGIIYASNKTAEMMNALIEQELAEYEAKNPNAVGSYLTNAVAKTTNRFVNLTNASLRIATIEFELDQAQLRLTTLEADLRSIDDYLDTLSKLPLDSFDNGIFEELRAASEEQLRKDFEFIHPLTDSLSDLAATEAMIIYQDILSVTDQVANPELHQYLTEKIAELSVMGADYTRILADPNMTEVIKRVRGLVADLKREGLSIRSISSLVKAERLNSARDHLALGLMHGQIDVRQMRAQLKEFKNKREAILKSIRFLLSSNLLTGSTLDEAKLVLFKDELANMGIVVTNPKETLLAISINDVDNPAYLALRNLLRDVLLKDTTEVTNAPPSLPGILGTIVEGINNGTIDPDTEINSTGIESLSHAINRYIATLHREYGEEFIIDSHGRAVDDLITQLNDLNSQRQQFIAANKLGAQMVAIEDYVMRETYTGLLNYFFEDKLKNLSRFDRDAIQNGEDGFMKKVGYTPNAKVTSMFFTTGLEDVFEIENGARLDDSGNYITEYGIHGVHKEDGSLLDPTNTADLKVIQQRLPMERWFSFVSSEDTTKALKNKTMTVELMTLKVVRERLQALIDSGDPVEKGSAEVMLKEIEELERSIISNNPSEQAATIIANTIIVVPINKDTGNFLYHKGYFDDTINPGKVTIPWSVMRDVETMFPTETVEDDRKVYSLDPKRIKVGWGLVRARMKNIKVIQRGPVLVVVEKRGKSYTEHTDVVHPITGEVIATGQIDISGLSQPEITKLKDILRQHAAIESLVYDYQQYKNAIIDANKPLRASIKRRSPGINMAVYEYDSTTGKRKAVMRDLKDFAINETDGKFKGRLAVVPSGSLIVGQQFYNQFAPGSLVYIDGFDTPMIARTKDLKELDPIFRDGLINVFLYAMLLAHDQQGLANITMAAGTFTNDDGLAIAKERNDNSDSDTIPVFPSSELGSLTPQVSVLEMFLNYGIVRTDGKLDPTKNQIFIEKGKIVFYQQDATGTMKRNEIALNDIIGRDPVTGEKMIDKANPALKPLLDYLDTKRFNVNKTMLKRSSEGKPFFIPRLKTGSYLEGTTVKIGNRQGIKLEHQKGVTYEQFLANNNIVEVLGLPKISGKYDLKHRFFGQQNLEVGKLFEAKNKEEKVSDKKDKDELLSKVATALGLGGNTASTSPKTKAKPKDKTDTTTANPVGSANSNKNDLLAQVTSILGLNKNPKKKISKVLSSTDNEEIKQNLSEIFGEEFVGTHYEFINGLIEDGVVGQFTEDGRILMSSLAAPLVEYHEAFHRVWRLFVPDKSQEGIIAEFKERANWQALVQAKREEGYKGESEQDVIEEILADEFMEYMRSRRANGSQTRSWFKRLFDFLMEFLFGTRTSRLFADIANGKFKNAKEIRSNTGSMNKVIQMPVRTVNGPVVTIDFINETIDDGFLIDTSDTIIVSTLQKMRDNDSLLQFDSKKLDFTPSFYESLFVDGYKSVAQTYMESHLYVKMINSGLSEKSNVADFSAFLSRQEKLPADILTILKDTYGKLDITTYGDLAYWLLSDDVTSKSNDKQKTNFITNALVKKAEVLNKKYLNAHDRRQTETEKIVRYIDGMRPLKFIASLDTGDKAELAKFKVSKEDVLNARQVIGGSYFNKRIVSYLKQFNISQEEEQEGKPTAEEVEKQISIENEISKDIANYKVSFEQDNKESMASSVKMLVASLGGEDTSYILYGKKASSWSDDVNVLQNSLASVPIEYMYNALKSLAANRPKFQELLEYFSTTNEEDEMVLDKDKLTLFTKFAQAMTNFNYELSIQMVEFDDNETSPRLYPANANVNTGAGVFLQQWVANLVIARDAAISNQTVKNEKEFLSNIVTFAIAHKQFGNFDYNKFLSVLTALHIPIPVGLNKDNVDKFEAVAPAGGKTRFVELVYNLVEELNKKLNGTPSIESLFDPTSNIKGTIDKITYILSLHQPNITMSLMNGEGSMYFTLNKNSYISAVIGNINHIAGMSNEDAKDAYAELQLRIQQELESTNSVDTLRGVESSIDFAINAYINNVRMAQLKTSDPRLLKLRMLYYQFPHIFFTDSNQYSIVKRRIFEYVIGNAKGKLPIKLVLKDSLKVDNDGVHMKNLDIVDLLAVDFSSASYGQFKSVQHADRSVYYYYESAPYIDLNGNPLSKSGSHTDIIFNYLIDEMTLYHYAKAEAASGTYPELTKLVLDNNGNLKTTYSGILHNILDTVIANTSLQEVWKTVMLAENVNDARAILLNNKGAIVSAIHDFVVAKGNEYISLLKDKGLLDDINVVDTNSTVARRPTNETERKNFIRRVWLNKFISHIEETKIFSGPPQFYGGSGNFWKRQVTQSSTGSLMQASKDNIEKINELNSQTEANFGVKYNKVEAGLVNEVVAKEEEITSFLIGDKAANESTLNAMIDYYTRVYQIRYPNLSSQSITAKAVKSATRYLKAYEKMNENDGMGWLNIFSYRAYEVFNGDWNDEKQEVFNFEAFVYAKTIDDIDKGKEFYTPIHELLNQYLAEKNKANGTKITAKQWFERYIEAFTTKKPQYVGPLLDAASKSGVFLNPTKAQKIMQIAIRKTAYDVLSPYILRGDTPKTRSKQFDMMRFMIERGIDVVHMGSAAKKGTKKQFTWYDGNNEFNSAVLDDGQNGIRQEYLGRLDWTLLKDQLKIHSEQENKIIHASQARKNLLAGLTHRGVPVDYAVIPGEPETSRINRWNSEPNKSAVSELWRLSEEYIELQRIVTGRLIQELKQELGFSGTGFKELNTIVQKLEKEATNRRYASNTVAMIKNLLESKAIETLPNRQRIESLLTSIITNNVIRQKRSGDALPQITSTGMEPVGTKRINNKSALLFYEADATQTKPSELIMPLPKAYIGKVMSHYEKIWEGQGKDKAEFNIFAAVEMLNEDIRNGTVTIKMMALRIPNQQLSSTDFAKVAKFYVPIKTNYVYVPSEIVVKVGSDFDIDKLQIYFPSLDSDLTPIRVDKNNPTAEDIIYLERIDHPVTQTDAYKAIDSRLKLSDVFDAPSVDSLINLADKLIRMVTENGLETDRDYAKAIKLLGAITPESTLNQFMSAFKSAGGLFGEQVDNAIETLSSMYSDVMNRDRQDKLREKQTYIKENMSSPTYMNWSAFPALHNEMLQIEEQILLHPMNFTNLIKPTMTQNADRLKDEYGIDSDVKDFGYSIDPIQNLYNAIYFVQGKLGVGRVALSINAKAILQSLDIKPRSKVFSQLAGRYIDTRLLFPNTEEVPSFGTMLDDRGDLIQDILSEILTTQVDNVKDPKAVRMGITLRTLGFIGYLINVGVSLDNIVKLLMTPAVKEYFVRAEINESKFRRSKKGVTKNVSDHRKEYVVSLIKKLSAEQRKELNNLLVSNTDKDAALELDYNKGNIIRNVLSKSDKVQEVVALLYTYDLIEIGKSYSELIIAVSPDNRAHKTLASAQRFNDITQRFKDNQIDTLISAEEFNKLLPTITGLSETNSTIVSSFYRGQDAYIDMMSPLFTTEKIEILKDMKRFLRGLIVKNVDPDYLDKFDNTVLNDFVVWLIMDTLPKEYHGSYYRASDLIIKEELSGVRSLLYSIGLGDRITVAQNLIETTKISNGRLTERVSSPVTVEDMLDIVQDTAVNNEGGQKLFMDLQLFSMFQSGINNSPFSFEKVLPFLDSKKELFNNAIAEVEKMDSTELKEKMFLFMDWFLRANPFVNGTERQQVIRERIGGVHSPYKFTYDGKNVKLKLDNKSVPTIGNSFFKDFTDASDSNHSLVAVSLLKTTFDKWKNEFVLTPGTITFTTESVRDYSARTVTNAKNSGLTIAIAEKFDTPGEAITKNAATESGRGYVAININDLKDRNNEKYKAAKDVVLKALKTNRDQSVANISNILHIAGNSEDKTRMKQVEIDSLVYEFLNDLNLRDYGINTVVTGGQSGVDEAGAKAGQYIGLNVRVHTTVDWKFKDSSGREVKNNEAAFKARFNPQLREC